MRGFRLAGVPGSDVATGADAAQALAAAAARPDCGVIIVTDRVAAGIRREVDAIRLGRERPLIVEVPGPDGPLPGRRSLRRIAQEAVGMGIGETGEGEDAGSGTTT